MLTSRIQVHVDDILLGRMQLMPLYDSSLHEPTSYQLEVSQALHQLDDVEALVDSVRTLLIEAIELALLLLAAATTHPSGDPSKEDAQLLTGREVDDVRGLKDALLDAISSALCTLNRLSSRHGPLALLLDVVIVLTREERLLFCVSVEQL